MFSLDADPNFNLGMEQALVILPQVAETQDPAYYRSVLLLLQPKAKELALLPYLTAPYFTENSGLWEYARRRLEWINKQSKS